MPAYTVSQLASILGEYRDPSGPDFKARLSQVIPRIMAMGLWRDTTYEVSLPNTLGYVSLPDDTDCVLAATVNNRSRAVRSMWHDIRITGRHATLSPYYGVVDAGWYPVLLDMKDVQDVDTEDDVTAVTQLDASPSISASGYAGTVTITGQNADGDVVQMTQSSSGLLEFTAPGLNAATATINPAGDNNSVLYTAATAGTAGNAISVTYSTPADAYEATVSVTGNAITVVPATKGRMTIAGGPFVGVITPSFTWGDLLYAGMLNSKPHFTSTGAPLSMFGATGLRVYWTGTQWHAEKLVSGFDDYRAISTDDVADPSLAAFVKADLGGADDGEISSITAGISSAAQVIAVVNDDVDASALVTASASGTVTGPVAAVAETNLSGGSDDSSIVSIQSITYDDVPASFDLVDPDYPTKIIATIPAGSGVVRYRRFRTSQPSEDSTVHLLVKRAAPTNLTDDTIIYLGNIGAIKHALLGLIAEDNADLDRADRHWGTCGRLLDEELRSILGAAKPTLNVDLSGSGSALPIYNQY